MEEVAAPRSSSARMRVAWALGSGLLLCGLIAAVVALGGGERSVSAIPAPGECLKAWNADADALAYGRHNRTFHNYSEAQVGYFAREELSVTGDAGSGACVVLFPRTSLDPEPIGAGQLLRGEGWVPLNEELDLNSVAELQSAAFEGANVALIATGELAAESAADAGSQPRAVKGAARQRRGRGILVNLKFVCRLPKQIV